MIPSKRFLRRFVTWSVAALVLLTAYFLSTGPAILFVRRTQMAEGPIGFIYAPVVWLSENTAMKEPINTYLDYFVEIDNDWDLPRLVVESAPPDLADVPNELMIAGKMVHFEASLCRDFMPVCPPNGQRMAAFFKVTTADRSYFPSGVRAEKAWVIHNTQAWIPQFDQPNTATKVNHAMCLIARANGGPRWAPGIRADVVIQLRDDQDNVYLLQVKNQEIIRTE